MDAGKLRREGEVVGEDVALDDGGAAEDIVDAMGNKVEVKKHKNLTAKEIKKQIKELEENKRKAIKGNIAELSNYLVSMWKVDDE